SGWKPFATPDPGRCPGLCCPSPSGWKSDDRPQNPTATMPVTLFTREGQWLHIPDRASESLTSFRDWAGDNDLPEKTRLDYYKGDLWIYTGKEQIWTHGLLKTEIAVGLDGLTGRKRL